MISFISTVLAGDTVDIGSYFNSPWGVDNDLGDFFSNVTNLGIIFAGVLFLFLVILAGYRILNGASSGQADSLNKGRDVLTYAIIGIVVVFTAFVAIRVIELMLGNSFFTGL